MCKDEKKIAILKRSWSPYLTWLQIQTITCFYSSFVLRILNLSKILSSFHPSFFTCWQLSSCTDADVKNKLKSSQKNGLPWISPLLEIFDLKKVECPCKVQIFWESHITWKDIPILFDTRNQMPSAFSSKLWLAKTGLGDVLPLVPMALSKWPFN